MIQSRKGLLLSRLPSAPHPRALGETAGLEITQQISAGPRVRPQRGRRWLERNPIPASLHICNRPKQQTLADNNMPESGWRSSRHAGEEAPFFMFKVCPRMLVQRCPKPHLRCRGSEFQPLVRRAKLAGALFKPPVLICSFKAPKSPLNIPQINSPAAFLSPQLSLTPVRKILCSPHLQRHTSSKISPRGGF